jgi:hypothetical protein
MRNTMTLCLFLLAAGCDDGGAAAAPATPASDAAPTPAPDVSATEADGSAPDAAPAPDAPPDAAPPATDAAPPPPLPWGACPDRFRSECTTLSVPLNHDDPEGESIDVFLSHRPGMGKQLWLLQGGPGASAESFTTSTAFWTPWTPIWTSTRWSTAASVTPPVSAAAPRPPARPRVFRSAPASGPPAWTR